MDQDERDKSSEESLNISHEDIEKIERELFEWVMDWMEKEGRPQVEMQNLREAFTEYMNTQQELYKQHGGQYQWSMILQAIPRNRWVHYLRIIKREL